MSDLMEFIFCSQQIVIPPRLPQILKKFTKAAIRTQPSNLLVWSAAYFKALHYGIPLPVKEKMEFPPVNSISGITPGFLKILINQIGNCHAKIHKKIIEDYWKGICLSEDALQTIFDVGGFIDEINWLKFIAICAGVLESTLARTMVLLCELLTDEPAGGSSHVPVKLFIYLYKYLARLDCGPEDPKKRAEVSVLKRKEDEFSEVVAGDEITYKAEDERVAKSNSEVSWESVIKKLRKDESEMSIYTTADQQGIVWKKLSEADTTNISKSSFSAESSICSDVGFQVFEPNENKLEKIQYIKEESDFSEDISTRDNLSQKSTPLESKKRCEGERVPDEEMLNIFFLHLDTNKAGKDKKKKHERSKKLNVPEPEPEEKDVVELVEVDSSTILVPTPEALSDYKFDLHDIQDVVDEKLSTGEHLGLARGSMSLYDLSVPEIKIPVLIRVEDELIPKTFVKEKKWVPIAGIGPKIPERQIERVVIYLKECAEVQNGVIMPRNLRHFLCPRLDLDLTEMKKCRNLNLVTQQQQIKK